MKPLTAPFSRVLSCVSIEYGKVALTVDASIAIQEGVRIFHRPPALPISVFRNTDFEGLACRRADWGMLVDGLIEGDNRKVQV
jgi:hypothetical protein